ncbi:peptidoglycan-binding domain-containing protein [Ferrovibrio sp.]|uniref:peptidoglycan-binding domain-containing protein n=1 Tax=Ferrovibrio sp. TaxID=1917215 RepID=UPI000CB7E2CC|nr:peptidoglycan-binding domain-containing protein [Ferrovibrio sp.]PJI39609.1 MAG: hypothetical protein CTR53_12365 [Ferrovibrio sp.]
MSLLPIDPDQNSIRPSFFPAIGDIFNLTGAIGPEAANARDDVIRAQILLGESGDLDLGSLGGPTGWPGSELTRGLKRYQRRKGLTVDGLMLPDGETIHALQALGERFAGSHAPTTAEVDDHHDRLARYRAEDSEDVELPRLELPRADDGRVPADARTVATDSDRLATIQPLSEVKSDIDDDGSLRFTPGAQVAQAAELMQMMQAQAAANAAAAAGGAVGASKQLPPGVTPEIDKVGHRLEKWVDDKINLLTLPVQAQRYLNDGTPINLPSALLDPAIDAASRTPR